MKRTALKKNAFGSFAVVVLTGAISGARAENAKTPYSTMAPVDQYMMERSAEIAMAQSAAPPSISKDAEVMVMGRHGYEVAVKGKNGFVCMVERGWTANADDPVFWNPKIRGPICFNPAAARFIVPITIKKTELALSGRSKEQMVAEIKAAFDKKELPSQEPGAMCYMLSKQGYLNDHAGHWHPHLMFFIPQVGAESWGANRTDSPILADEVGTDRLTIFMVQVGKWSDGTDDSHEP